MAVNGAPVAATPAGLKLQLSGPVGSKLTITTRSRDGALKTHVLTRDPRHFREALAPVGLTPRSRNVLYALPALLHVFLLLACALVLMIRRGRDPLAPWASLMMLCMVIGLEPGLGWFVNLFPDPVLAGNAANAAAFSLLITVLAAFPTGRFEPRWSLSVAVFGTVAMVVAQPLPSRISNALLVLFLLAAVGAIAARYRAMSPGTGRQQIRWALFGFAASAGVLCLIVLSQFVRAGATAFGPYAWTELGAGALQVLFLGLLMLGITVSLLRYRLYDADATISRTIAYSLVTVALLAVFAGSEKVVEVLGEEYFGERLGALAGGLGAAIAAVMIVPMHHRMAHWAERRFRSGLAHLREGLPLLVADLRETATPKALAATLLARVEPGVRAQYGAVIVHGAVLETRDIDAGAVNEWLSSNLLRAEASQTLDCDRSDPLFPLRVPLSADGAGLVGWLLLGPRPDGSFFGREERAALQEIADPVARALAVAGARERRESDRDREIASLRRSIGSLQRRLALPRSTGKASA